jgi:hypothetical protein
MMSFHDATSLAGSRRQKFDAPYRAMSIINVSWAHVPECETHLWGFLNPNVPVSSGNWQLAISNWQNQNPACKRLVSSGSLRCVIQYRRVANIAEIAKIEARNQKPKAKRPKRKMEAALRVRPP